MPAPRRPRPLPPPSPPNPTPSHSKPHTKGGDGGKGGRVRPKPPPPPDSPEDCPVSPGDEEIRLSEEDMSSSDRMLVLARVRPLNSIELSDATGESSIIVSVQNTPGASLINVNLTNNQVESSKKEYRLDSTFGPTAGQEDVFNATIPLLRAALAGYNSTIFTYGQTGTGKTHTMLGHDLWALAAEVDEEGEGVKGGDNDRNARGIIPRALQYVFKQIKVMSRKSASVRVEVSYTEIYNERVKDLLAVANSNTTMYTTPNVAGVGAAMMTPSKQKGGMNFGLVAAEDPSSNLDIREDKKNGIVVPNLTMVPVVDEEAVFQVLWKGAKNRAMASTNMNERSSRSHTILGVRLQVEQGGVVRMSKINLVDLAGSERYKTHQMAQFSEQRIKELTSINQSLSALGNCISALTGKAKTHIPYRNSKLTRLLQDSLGGNCRTMFIVTVSPSHSCCDETVSTLQFADRAMRVRVFASSNERLASNDPLKQAQHEIARLKTLLQAAIARTPSPRTPSAGDKAGGGGGGAGGNGVQMQMVEKMDAQAQAEAASLRDENLKLAEEISRLRESLSREKSEKAKLLEAIYGAEGEEGEEGVGNLANNQKAQLRVLNAQRSLLEQRQEEIEVEHKDQEERWEWLESYHTWLRNLPVAQSVGAEGGELEGAEVTLYDRLCMMETSVLLQSQELKRTKRLFLKDKDRLEQQIVEKEGEIEKRDKRQMKGDEKEARESVTLMMQAEDLKCEIADLKLKLMGKDKMLEKFESSGAGVALGLGLGVVGTPKAAPSASASGVGRGYADAIENLNQFTFDTAAKGAVEVDSSFNDYDGYWNGGGEEGGAAGAAGEGEFSSLSSAWTEHYDATHGVPYFYNKDTKETVWEKPEGE